MPSSSEAEEELYASVEDVLEGKGVLSAIRAQLRAAVFEAIIDAEDGRPTEETQRARERISALPSGDLGLALVTDFLASCGLRRSLCVLVPEAGMKETKVDRRRLRSRLGLADSSDDAPILCDLLATQKKQPLESKTSEEDSAYDEDDFENDEDLDQRPIIQNLEDIAHDDHIDATTDHSLHSSPLHARQPLEDSDSFLLDLAEDSSSLNDRLEFSVRSLFSSYTYILTQATATSVDGPHVLDEQGDFIESLDSLQNTP